jgi:hypothetical protein
MKIAKITIIEASDGMVLYNGKGFGSRIRLADWDSPDNWWEITEEEAAEIRRERKKRAEAIE